MERLPIDLMLAGVPADRRGPEGIRIQELPIEVGGCTGHDADGRTIFVAVPSDNTVRVHEVTHAAHSGNKGAVYGCIPPTVLDISYQAVEDVRMQTACYPFSASDTPRILREAAIHRARIDLKEVRTALKKTSADKMSPDQYNISLLIALRSVAILKYFGQRKTEVSGFGERVNSVIQDAITDIGYPYSLLLSVDALMRRKPEDFKGPESENGEPDETTVEDHGGTHVKIVELPKPIDSESELEEYTSTRGRLNLRNIGHVYTDGRVFTGRVQTATGSVMIDASGSMRLTEEDLDDIARSMPAGFIGYYSGTDFAGEIVVYARDGMRAAQVKNPAHGSNGIDAYALEYLMRQPAPRLFVSDLKFNGGDRDVQYAKELLATLRQQGLIEIRESVAEVRARLETTGRVFS